MTATLTRVVTDDGIELSTSSVRRYAIFVVTDDGVRAVTTTDDYSEAERRQRLTIGKGYARVVLVSLSTGTILRDLANPRPLSKRPATLLRRPPAAPRTDRYEPDCVRCRYAGPTRSNHSDHTKGTK